MRPLGPAELARLVRQNVDSQRGQHGAEDGAAAILVAMLFGMGVLLGCSALVIDVGALQYERRQVQNGADAAALALAQECALKHTCDSTTIAQLTILAGQNAEDQFTDLSPTAPVCGSSAVITPLMSECIEPVSPTMADCLPLPVLPATAKWVEVRTQTRQGSGSTSSLLPPIFGRAVLGSNSQGSTVKACARAAWGPSSLPSANVPIAISLCEWEANTGGSAGGIGTYYPPPTGASPGYGGGGLQSPWPTAAQDRVVYLQNSGSPTVCPSFNGHQAPGGFGWIKDQITGATGCGIHVADNSWAQTDTGANVACDLSTSWEKPIYLPVFDCMVDSSTAPTAAPDASTNCQSGNGSKLWYHIVGFASFYLSGYHFSGSDEKISPASGVVPCSGGNKCLSGWFTRSLVDSSAINNTATQDLGLRTIIPAG